MRVAEAGLRERQWVDSGILVSLPNPPTNSNTTAAQHSLILPRSCLLQLRAELQETIALTRSELQGLTSSPPISPSHSPLPSENQPGTASNSIRNTAPLASHPSVQCGPESRPDGYRIQLEPPLSDAGRLRPQGLGTEGPIFEQPAAKRPRLAGGAAGNARMHPRNRYAGEEPDFAALAARHPGLEAVTTRRSNGRCVALVNSSGE